VVKMQTARASRHFCTQRTDCAADVGSRGTAAAVERMPRRWDRCNLQTACRLAPVLSGDALAASRRALNGKRSQGSHAMRNLQTVLALVLPAVVALPVQAGIIFGRHAKPNPAQRVPELVVMVKTDQNESRRESAAKELRNYDPTVYTDIVPVLIDVLQRDASTGVRLEAAQSLGKLRPISQEAGWALEQALKDSSIRVRIQARNSLWGYRLGGYHGDNHDNHMAQTPSPAMPPTASVAVPPPNTAMPAAAAPATTTPATAAKSPLSFLNPFRQASNPAPTVTVTPSNASVINAGETPPPPLAKPAAPAETPRVPKASSTDAGPDLSPGKD
jgi:hypothetical protein